MRKRGTGGRLTCAAGAPDPPAARENDERSLAQNLTRSRLGLGLRRQRERRRGKRIERGGRERGRGSEGVDGGSAATVSTLRRMARVTVGEARRAREIAGGSAAACGGGDGRMARVTGGGEGWVFLYRADAGPATFTGPCSGRHRGLACRPKHGTDLVPGRHGHAACRARPCSGRASPCRATGRPAGRPEMDMYTPLSPDRPHLACGQSACSSLPGRNLPIIHSCTC